MRFSSFSAFLLCGALFVGSPAHAELKINPFPMGENLDGPSAQAEPQSILQPPPSAVIHSEDMKGNDNTVVLPLPDESRRDKKRVSKLDRERALYDSLNVPSPGSSYFDDNADYQPQAREALVPLEPLEVSKPAAPLVARSSDLLPQQTQDVSVEGAREAVREAEPIDLQGMAIKSRYLDGKEINVTQHYSATTPAAGVEEEVMLPPLETGQAVVASVPQEISQAPRMPEYTPRADKSRLVRLDMQNGKIERMDDGRAGNVSEQPPLHATTLSAMPEVEVASVGSVETVSFQKNWVANEGDSIRSILQAWASQENVELVWDSMNEFAVLGTFDMNSSFEAAVQGLLDQYLEGEVRPVARLHYDPSSQDKILIVQVEGL